MEISKEDRGINFFVSLLTKTNWTENRFYDREFPGKRPMNFDPDAMIACGFLSSFIFEFDNRRLLLITLDGLSFSIVSGGIPLLEICVEFKCGCDTTEFVSCTVSGSEAFKYVVISLR